jgi:benzodiazapine receptor
MTPTIIVAALIVIVLMGVGGGATRIGPWYRQELRKPRWTPPTWAFGPAWTVILTLAAWAGVLAWGRATDVAGHVRIGVLFGVNIVLHLAWSPLFFNLKRPDWAMIEIPFLWVSILALVVGVAPYSGLAAWLLAPYLAWVSFAAILNLTIVRLNPPFGQQKMTS